MVNECVLMIECMRFIYVPMGISQDTKHNQKQQQQVTQQQQTTTHHKTFLP